MKDEMTRLLAAVRPAQFGPGTAIDGPTRERELATAFATPRTGRPADLKSTPLGPAGQFRHVSQKRYRGVAVPAAAALGVALVAAGLWAVRQGAPAPARKHASGPPGLVRGASVPPSARAARIGMPSYYVVASHLLPVAQVRSATRGRVLSSVPLPAGVDPKQTKISAAGGDRTYVLALTSYQRTRFYLLRVRDLGRVARLTPLSVPPLPADAAPNAIAASPDGRKLAVALQYFGGQHGAVEVVTLATGAIRTWTTARSGLPWQLSWADHGRELGFFWQDTGPSGSAGGLRVLDTTAPGSDLMSSRLILPTTAGGNIVDSAVLSSDGTTIDAAVSYGGVSHLGRKTVVGGIVEISARTGHSIRTLLTEHAAHSSDPHNPGWYIGQCQLFSADATGNHLLVSCDRFGRLDGAWFTALPGAAPQTAVATAW